MDQGKTAFIEPPTQINLDQGLHARGLPITQAITQAITQEELIVAPAMLLDGLSELLSMKHPAQHLHKADKIGFTCSVCTEEYGRLG